MRGTGGERLARHRVGRSRPFGGGIGGLVVVLLAVVAVLVAADSFRSLGRIHAGVEAGSVPLGGKTPEEARKVLEERIPGALEEVRFAGGPKE